MKEVIIKTIVLILAVILIGSLVKNITNYNNKQSAHKILQNNFDELEDKNKKLKGEIPQSKNPFSYERMIRDNLNLTKPGERVVILPPSSLTPTPTSQPTLPPYRQWIELLF